MVVDTRGVYQVKLATAVKAAAEAGTPENPPADEAKALREAQDSMKNAVEAVNRLKSLNLSN